MLHPPASPTSAPVTSDRKVTVEETQNPVDRVNLEIQAELDRLEEMILECPRLPIIGKTLVDEDKLLDTLDQIRLNLPAVFRKAEAITHHKEEIFRQAEQYAREIVESAEKRAEEILDELGLVRKAELEVQEIRQRVQEECETLQKQTLSEIAMMRLQAQQEIEQMRQVAIAEREDIQNQADEYADRVLASIEQNLQSVTAVVRGGREKLQEDLGEIRAQAQKNELLSTHPSHHNRQNGKKSKPKKKPEALPEKSVVNSAKEP
jgi:vacuolar-type H+-ATPase subunit H